MIKASRRSDGCEVKSKRSEPRFSSHFRFETSQSQLWRVTFKREKKKKNIRNHGGAEQLYSEGSASLSMIKVVLQSEPVQFWFLLEARWV